MPEIGNWLEECRLPFLFSLTPLVFVSPDDDPEAGRGPKIVDNDCLRIDWNKELEWRRLKNSEAELFRRVLSMILFASWGLSQRVGSGLAWDVCFYSHFPCLGYRRQIIALSRQVTWITTFCILLASLLLCKIISEPDISLVTSDLFSLSRLCKTYICGPGSLSNLDFSLVLVCHIRFLIYYVRDFWIEINKQLAKFIVSIFRIGKYLEHINLFGVAWKAWARGLNMNNLFSMAVASFCRKLSPISPY